MHKGVFISTIAKHKVALMAACCFTLGAVAILSRGQDLPAIAESDEAHVVNSDRHVVRFRPVRQVTETFSDSPPTQPEIRQGQQEQPTNQEANRMANQSAPLQSGVDSNGRQRYVEKLRDPFPMPPEMVGIDLSKQTPAQAAAKSTSCIACHQTVKDPHFSKSVQLGCTDCHGGDANANTIEKAHVLPRFPEAWPKSANPVRSYTLLNRESPEFIRFVNPGDLRVAHIACGSCHGTETIQVKKSMMTHGCMLWGAALYNNGAVPNKWSRYGESYSMDGTAQRLQTVPPPTPYEMDMKGVLPYLDPLPRFQTSHPGNILRIFERGGRFKLETGIPETKEEPGRPRARLSNRGLGTINRSDPTFLGLGKDSLA